MGTITLLLLLLFTADRLFVQADLSVLNFLSGSGDLTFTFNLYFSNDVLVTTGYTIDLESQLYALLTVNGGGFSTLDVHYEALKATTNEEYSLDLIEDG